MTSTKKNINKEIIALFSGQSSIITTPKLYIQLTGNHSLAVVLNQCVFWSNKSDSGDDWFYKDYKDWFDEIHIPERTLRRRFEKLEQNGWILTKVKKVKGLNVKHIKPCMDKIIESISNMLDSDCPNRPTCPDGKTIEQKTCTNIAPTGQIDRSESANLSVSSIYTYDNYQKKLTNCDSSSSFIFSELTDKNMLKQKLNTDTRTDEEFLNDCLYHVENNSNLNYPKPQRANALIKLLKKLKSENVLFVVKKKIEEKKVKNETKEDRAKRYQEEREAQRKKIFG